MCFNCIFEVNEKLSVKVLMHCQFFFYAFYVFIKCINVKYFFFEFKKDFTLHWKALHIEYSTFSNLFLTIISNSSSTYNVFPISYNHVQDHELSNAKYMFKNNVHTFHTPCPVEMFQSKKKMTDGNVIMLMNWRRAAITVALFERVTLCVPARL